MIVKNLNNYGTIVEKVEGDVHIGAQGGQVQSLTQTVKREADFRQLIQHPEPERLLQRLHLLIDGRGGATVGSVLLKCKQENYLMANPTQAQFCSEFQLVGSWSAIHNYMDENNLNALEKANRIVIFD